MRRRPVLVFPNAHQRGGVERITWQVLRHLSARGPVVFVGHSIEPALHGVQHVDVEPRGGRATAPFRFRTAAARAIEQVRGPDDVVVSFGANCPPGDVRVVNSVHRAWLRRGRPIRVGGRTVPNAVRYVLARHLVLLALERSYFRAERSGSVVAVSEEVASDLGELYGVPRDRVSVIPNGFDEAQCSPRRRQAHRAAQRAEWGIADGALALLFVANELHRKGFDCLLEAVAIADEPSMEIHVVGRAPIEPYSARISDLGLQARVNYHGSVDIGLAHAAADALVLPTQYEAFALTVVEALASGLPVITTSVPGAGDRISDGLNGLLQHDPSNAVELAGLLTQISDADTRTRLGAAGPASVADLEWDQLAGQLDAVVQESP